MLGSGIGSGIGSAIGNIAVLAGAAGDGGMSEYKKAVKQILGLPEEIDFDMRDVPPAVLQMAAQLRPSTYEAVVPGQAALAQDSLPGRSGQLYVMEELRRRAQQGEPVGERLANQTAENTMAAELGRSQQNLMGELARRGRLGAGAALSARAGFGQEASNYARDSGMALAQMNIGNRLGALRSLGDISSTERGQTQSLEEGRANAINRMNEYVSTMLTGANRYAADAQNQANVYNTETRQRLSDFNQQNRQATQERNLDRNNQSRYLNANYGLDRGQAAAGVLALLGRAKDAETAAKANAITGIGSGLGGALGGLIGGV